MRLFWVGLIFGAGYALGRPEGRAKLAELSKRPEVTQLRQRAASTVSSGAKTGQQQLAKAAHTVKDKASEKLPGKTTDGSGAVPAAGPAETASGTATADTSASPVSVNAVPVAPSAASPEAPDHPR